MTELAWGESTHRRIGDVDVHVESTHGATDDGADPASTRTVALLHGFASGTFSWAGLAPRLNEAGHRVVAWDRPPFGRTSRPRPRRGPGDPYGTAAEIERTRTVLAGVAAPVLVGHSAGALAAVQAVVAGAVTPSALVLLAPALSGGPPTPLLQVARVPGTGALGRVALRYGLPRADVALRRMSRHPNELQRATAAATASSLAQPGTADALWHLVSTWTAPAFEAESLAAHAMPILVIAGADDRISTPEASTALAGELGAEIVVLDDTGHAPHEQRPDVVADLVTGFLTDNG